MDNVVELDEYVDNDLEDFAMENVQYPCIFIDGITTEEEVQFFRSKERDVNTSLPMYCMIEGIPLSLGRLELSLDSLLELRSLFDYKITLYRSINDKVPIDLNDAQQLIKFIKL